MGTRRVVTIVLAPALLLAFGAVATQSARGTRASAAARPSFAVQGTYVPLAGDFDGDGRSDIFWYAAGAAPDSVWFGGADRRFTKAPESVVGSYRPVVIDINGDGRSDILWYGPGSAPDRLWLGKADRTFVSHPFAVGGGAGLQPYAGDFNGDGHADIFWYARQGGTDYMWSGRGDGTFTWRGVSVKGLYNVVVGDFEHIGRDQILLDGTWPEADTIIADAVKANGTFHDWEIYGTVPGGVPVALDANGDGREDVFFYGPGPLLDQVGYSIAVSRPNPGPVFSLNTTSIDGANYIPLAGDFDGDGHDDIFWYGRASAPDSVWFDVAHEIPALRGTGPLQRWQLPESASFPAAFTADKTAAYALLTDGSLTAHDRNTGIPRWSRSIGAPCGDAQLQRQLEILKVACFRHSAMAHTYVYTADTGAPLYDQPGQTCWSDNSYYDARFLSVGGGTLRLTVVAARTGATIWQSPVTKVAPCALSGTRLTVAHVWEDGVVEYDFIGHRTVFDHNASNAIRFGRAGFVAMCSSKGEVWGLGPSGSTAWTTHDPCVAPRSAHIDFGTTAVIFGADIDIATGKLLGRQPIPASFVYGTVETESPDGAMFSWRYEVTAVRVGQCLYSSDVAFAGPHGVSPLLKDAYVVPIDFSHRAIAVFRGDPNNPCTRPQLSAFDQDGHIRWAIPRQWEVGGIVGGVGSDRATNGGEEASVLVGSGGTGIELLSLP